MSNKILFNYYMHRNNEIQKTLAPKLGLKPATLSMKVTGKSRFSLDEIGKLRIMWKLTDTQVVKIFVPGSGDISAKDKLARRLDG